jgi:hypothetical protein
MQGSSEEIVFEALQQAFAANPFVAVFLAYHEIFSGVVECVDELDPASCKQGSIEEAFCYCSNQADMEQWLELEDLLKWLQRCFDGKRLPLPTCDEGCYTDEMYAGMFATAVEMISEQQQQQGQSGFVGAATFEGNRPGYVFTQGSHGLGYYRDDSTTSALGDEDDEDDDGDDAGAWDEQDQGEADGGSKKRKHGGD